MININITGEKIEQQEIDAYIKWCTDKYSDREITGIDIKVDGDDVELTCHSQPEPFQRIRRITGYLVGTIDKFNNAKRAEVRDRVKHSIA